jgi:hypothetical protein
MDPEGSVTASEMTDVNGSPFSCIVLGVHAEEEKIDYCIYFN